MVKSMENVSNNYVKINSILLGLYISINMITKIITAIYSFQNNVPIIISTIFIFSLIYNKFKINRMVVFINLFVIILLLLSIFRVDDYTYVFNYFISYLIYGLVAMNLISYKVDFKKVISTVNWIFLIFTIILLIVYIPKIAISTNLDFTMDLSYTSLIGISSVLFSFKYCKVKKLIVIIEIIALIINIWYLLVLSNNRGAIFVLSILILLLIMDIIKNYIAKIIIIISYIICSYILINNLEKILFEIHEIFLVYFNTRINWLERFLFQMQKNDILTGRDVLYHNAYNMFIKNPILGNGIGYFEIYNNGQYPHNIILQMLCEYGIIITVFFAFFIILSFKYIINNKGYKEINFLKLFFVLSIPRLMFSGSYWEIQFFWLYIFTCILIFKKEINKTYI